MLSKKAIAEYRQIYREEFGTEISYAEALEQGTKLLSLMKIIYRPIPITYAEEYENDKVRQS